MIEKMNRCECGAGAWAEGDGLNIQPHSIGCSVLKQIAERERTHCVKCGAAKMIEQGGQVIYCPNGHSLSVSGDAALDALEATGSGWIREVGLPIKSPCTECTKCGDLFINDESDWPSLCQNCGTSARLEREVIEAAKRWRQSPNQYPPGDELSEQWTLNYRRMCEALDRLIQFDAQR